MKKKLNFIVDNNNSSDAVIKSKIISEFGEDALNQENIVFGKDLKKSTFKKGITLNSIANSYENVIIFNEKIKKAFSMDYKNNTMVKYDVFDKDSHLEDNVYFYNIGFKDDNGVEITDYDAIIYKISSEKQDMYFRDGGAAEKIDKIILNGVSVYDENAKIEGIMFDKGNQIVCFYKDTEIKINKHTDNNYDTDKLLITFDNFVLDENTSVVVVYQEEYDKFVIAKYNHTDNSAVYGYGTKDNITETGDYKEGMVFPQATILTPENSFCTFELFSENKEILKFFTIDLVENDNTLPQSFIDVYGSSYYKVSATCEMHEGDTLVSKNGIIPLSDNFKLEHITSSISKEVLNAITARVEEVANSIPTVSTVEEITNSIISNETLLSSLSSAVIEKTKIAIVAKNGDEITSNLVYNEDKNAYVLDYDTSLLDGTDYTIELKIV